MRWITGAVLLLVFALLLRLELVAYAVYVFLAVLAVSRGLAYTWAQHITASRECSRMTAEVGDTVAVIITLENTGRIPIAWLLAEDLLPRRALMFRPPDLRLQGSRIGLHQVPARGRRRIRYQLTCNRRGYYQLGPLVAETGDLFGLHRRFRVVAAPHFLLVFPPIVALEGYEIASRRPLGEVRMTYRLYEDPTRIAGVRAYQPGDALNRVHWRASARTGLLHSKVYEPSTVVGATVLLEFHRSSHSPHHEPYRSELAVVAAASIANAVFQMGQQIGLVTNGRDAADRIRLEGWDYDPRSRQQARQAAGMQEQSDRLRPVTVQTRRGDMQLQRILETLARVELTDGLRLPELIAEVEGQMPRDATVIAILPGATVEIVVALAGLKRRGFAVTAVLNLFEESEFAAAAGSLVAIGVDVHHLKDESRISRICQRFLLR